MHTTQRGFSTVAVALIALLVIGGGIALFASSHASKSAVATDTHAQPMEGSSADKEKDMAMMGPSVMLKDGKLTLEDKGVSSALTSAYVFSDGTKVSLKGVVTKKDGSTATLMEGESVWPGGDIMKAGEAMMGSSTESMGSMKAGAYETYDPKLLAMAATGKVVLFFHATWCPICHSLDQDIRAHLNQIPEHTTILVVDYDTSASLKQKYGVTVQHTFVQVDKDGGLIKKWSDSSTLADVLGQIK